jgi:hypothetical protein
MNFSTQSVSTGIDGSVTVTVQSTESGVTASLGTDPHSSNPGDPTGASVSESHNGNTYTWTITGLKPGDYLLSLNGVSGKSTEISITN